MGMNEGCPLQTLQTALGRVLPNNCPRAMAMALRARRPLNSTPTSLATGMGDAQTITLQRTKTFVCCVQCATASPSVSASAHKCTFILLALRGTLALHNFESGLEHLLHCLNAEVIGLELLLQPRLEFVDGLM